VKAVTIKDILKRLDAIEAKLNPPEAIDPAVVLDLLMCGLDATAARMRAQPDFKEPTAAQLAEAGRQFEATVTGIAA
jgi:hypothetical protein